MGYYIETPRNLGKAEYLAEHVADARIADGVDDAAMALACGEGVIVVVNNGPFEAAAFAYNENEFIEFTQPHDRRPKKYVVMPYLIAAKLSGYDASRMLR